MGIHHSERTRTGREASQHRYCGAADHTLGGITSYIVSPRGNGLTPSWKHSWSHLVSRVWRGTFVDESNHTSCIRLHHMCAKESCTTKAFKCRSRVWKITREKSDSRLDSCSSFHNNAVIPREVPIVVFCRRKGVFSWMNDRITSVGHKGGEHCFSVECFILRLDTR